MNLVTYKKYLNNSTPFQKIIAAVKDCSDTDELVGTLRFHLQYLEAIIYFNKLRKQGINVTDALIVQHFTELKNFKSRDQIKMEIKRLKLRSDDILESDDTDKVDKMDRVRTRIIALEWVLKK